MTTLSLPRRIPDTGWDALTRAPEREAAISALPEVNRRFDIGNIEDACALLDITMPDLRIKISMGKRVAGTAKFPSRAGALPWITVSRLWLASDMSLTLWHELTHIAQWEVCGRDTKAFMREYAQFNRLLGYRNNPLERQANDNARMFSEDCPLVVAC